MLNAASAKTVAGRLPLLSDLLLRAHRYIWTIASLLLLEVHSAWSDILRVPSEYSTIQSALNSLVEDDTVLVTNAIYQEALIAPLVSFSLLGDVVPDSALDNLPTIDPSGLPHPEELACLTFMQSIPFCRIERISFRNGPEMYPRDEIGGIEGNVTHLFVRQSKFDSTFYGIGRVVNSGDLIELDSCLFENNPVGCVSTEEHRVVARNSSFNGAGFTLVNCASNSQFERCRFSGATSAYHLLIDGEATVTQCEFSGNSPDVNAWLFLLNGSGTVAENVFHNGQFATFAVHAERNCTLPLSITGNIFNQLFDVTPIVIECLSPGLIPAMVDSNIFTAIVTPRAKAVQIEPDAKTLLSANRMIGLSPFDHAVVFSACDSVVARQNLFIANGLAYQAFSYNDARHNYWGDSTGPYNALNNPQGHGDNVSDSVFFDPWYPDTSFLVDAADDPTILHPSSFILSVFPNPFNSTARIELDVPSSFIGEITLTNLLGQTIRSIHRGPLYGRETFTLQADDLASGVYFLSVRDVLKNTVTASAKLLLLK